MGVGGGASRMAPVFILAAMGATVPSWPPDLSLMIVAAGNLFRWIWIVRTFRGPQVSSGSGYRLSFFFFKCLVTDFCPGFRWISSCLAQLQVEAPPVRPKKIHAFIISYSI